MILEGAAVKTVLRILNLKKSTYYRRIKLSEEDRTSIKRKPRSVPGFSYNHCKEVVLDTRIKEFPAVKGVVHCFSGSVEFAELCLKEGYYLGVTGVVTFKNAKKIAQVVEKVPLERLLVETDCPYIAPTPNRGKRNQSNYIKYIIDQIAEIKKVSPEEVSRVTINNVKNMLGIE